MAQRPQGARLIAKGLGDYRAQAPVTVKVSTPVKGATYTAELHPDGTVSVWVERVSFVGEGRWVGHEIEIRSRLISDATRARLSRALGRRVSSRIVATQETSVPVDRERSGKSDFLPPRSENLPPIDVRDHRRSALEVIHADERAVANRSP